MMDKKLVVIRGGGDVASGIAVRLFNSGFKVIILEAEKPYVIRRKVSFAEAVYEREVEIEGIAGRLTESMEDAISTADNNMVSVLVDPDLRCLKQYKPFILVDSILAKRNTGVSIGSAGMVIGVGPGFTAGIDVDAVVETNRGHYLGKVILSGCAAFNTGIPGDIEGFTEDRVLRAPSDGEIEVIFDIGTIVEAHDTVARIGSVEVKTKIKGVVRGMIKNGYHVTSGMKIGDVDPRGEVDYCFTVSDKARAVGGAVLEAILYLYSKMKNI